VSGRSAAIAGVNNDMNHRLPLVRRVITCFVLAFITTLSLSLPCRAVALDLTSATVVTLGASKVEKKAVVMLIDEVHKRTGIRWKTAAAWPATGGAVIVVGKEGDLPALAGRFTKSLASGLAVNTAEGYRIQIRQDDAGAAVFILGSDDRGVLFGVGRILRALHMTQAKITLADDFNIATAPKYRLRGHQLGYRPKTNSYDGWDVAQWEQYYRDLIVFGANAVELIPPRSDDAATSPHFPLPPLKMMTRMSGLADDYGLDVWIWYPAIDRDYSNPATVEAALAEWGQVFEKLPRIDAVFVPGGDPGHTQPKFLMALLEKQTQVLHRTHPNAKMWVSPQSFNQKWLDEFLEILKRDRPTWLSGIVFGPQVRISLPELRAAVPAQYPIRHYPDITHSRQCQYPVPDWDVAYAATESRECINPRPLGQATIFRLLQPQTIGFLTYSEGCNDDVNKAVWSGLGWDPETPVVDILRDYAGYYIGDRYRDDFAQGLLALERNWQGSLVANTGVETTLEQFQTMERQATPAELKNWRFQQALYRAYCDAYVRRRLLAERNCESRALESLARGESNTTDKALDDAEAILDSGQKSHIAPSLRGRISDLADELFDSIRMQLSVKRHQAIAVDRGATLDTVDVPLNNCRWLKQRFAAIRKLPTEVDRQNAVREIVEWTNPGPGGFYDDLGNLAQQPHLVVGKGFSRDPAFLESAHVGFAGPELPNDADDDDSTNWRMSWIDHAESLLESPLTMHYTDLDREAQYKLRVVYAGDGLWKKVRLIAGDGIEIHPYLTKPFPVAPIEFDIPVEATRPGELTLRWFREAGLGDNGRGCQVSEVWLIKKPTKIMTD
jgi:hypothetical protein